MRVFCSSVAASNNNFRCYNTFWLKKKLNEILSLHAVANFNLRVENSNGRTRLGDHSEPHISVHRRAGVGGMGVG